MSMCLKGAIDLGQGLSGVMLQPFSLIACTEPSLEAVTFLPINLFFHFHWGQGRILIFLKYYQSITKQHFVTQCVRGKLFIFPWPFPLLFDFK